MNYVEVDPVKVVESSSGDGKTHQYRYSFDKIHIGELEGELDSILSNIDAKAEHNGDHIWYKYGNKTEVIVKEDVIKAPEGSVSVEAGRQAYFVLSILESEGYVSGISKVKA